ncbi:type II toxin-antitoxin system RelE/ParE family toxin [Candidatus Desantisbacteria bacterium]|nr:type II toxin-antitoxin system RelE/ParE family toxin [Candidatus Desantisbacteria bacterium]
MAKIKWTPQSLDDIDAVSNFIARDSVYYAQTFAVEVFETVEHLKLFPESGRIVPELNRSEIKEVIFGNYRIIYRIKEELVEILTVYHSARLLDINKIVDLL